MSESLKSQEKIKINTKRKKNYISSSSSEEKSDEDIRMHNKNLNKENEIEKLKLNLNPNKEENENNKNAGVESSVINKKDQTGRENHSEKIDKNDDMKTFHHQENNLKDNKMIKKTDNDNEVRDSSLSRKNTGYAEKNNLIKINEIINKHTKEIDYEESLRNNNSYYKGPKVNDIRYKDRDFEKGFDFKSQNERGERFQKNSDLVNLDQKGFNNDNLSHKNDRNLDFPYFSKNYDNMNNNLRFNGNNRGRGRGNRGGRNFDRDSRNDFNREDNTNNRFNFDNNFNRGRRVHIDDYKFYTENEKIVKKIKDFYEFMDENDIIKHLKIMIQNGSITIFEFLNEFHRENIIIRHEKYSNVENKKSYSVKINILEQDKDSLDPNIKFMIESYKTIPQQNSEPLIFPSEFYEREEEKRRKIFKDENGFFNYIPIKCNEHILADTNDFCKYSHNDNEIKYHSLVYKTQFCSRNCQAKETCKNAHDAKEFRKIYELHQKDGFTKFILKIEKYLRKKNLLKDYLEYVELPMSFSLETFKVHKCKFKNCNIDSHLCYFYHNEYERRRHPRLFPLINKECENCFITNDLKIKECVEGDFCKYFHNKYEMVYHEYNFRRQIKCQRVINKSTGKCVYFDTCYGIHKANEEIDNENYAILSKYKILKEKATLLAKTNKELKERLSEVEEENEELSKVVSCRKCGNRFINYEIIFLSVCEHALCSKCLENSLKKNKRCCVICNEKIEKNSLLKINLNPELADEQNNELKEKNKNRNKGKNNSDSE